MIRILDIILSIIGLLVLLPIILLILGLGYLDTGSPIFRQQRVGRNLELFTLIKFRTMPPGTLSVGTHLINASAVTSLGKFLRRSKLDELPQLINVIRGDMSLVGPRPCLPNQIELVEERDKRQVFSVRPGITGLAQIKNIDMSKPRKLAIYDRLMIRNFRLSNYFCLIIATTVGLGFGDRVKPG